MMAAELKHEATLWKPTTEAVVECFLCAHRCHIAPGNRGMCRVRENVDGCLVTLAYGRVIARHVDPIEKKPLFHFLPGSKAYSIATVGCNFQCGFCQNWQISQWPQTGDGAFPGETLTPEEVVSNARFYDCASISYTYTEPTVFFEYARDCGRLAHEAGLKNTFVTNGYATPEAVEAMAGWLDAANVDLKAWDDAFYRRLCKAHVEPVKETIRRMHEAGIHVEVTTLIVPHQNDDRDDLKALAEFLAGISPDLVWHMSRFHPDYDLLDVPATPLGTIEEALGLGRAAGLRFVYAGNVAGWQDTPCPACGTCVIARTGFGVTKTNLRGSLCGQCREPLPIITE